ncbi:MAG: AraC family transcriptional regulator [Oscillospiraceae bacterium]|nr:AraC family transcriptional regulator [Oscillospiraceae bacterium]
MTITDISFNRHEDEFYRPSFRTPGNTLVLYILKSPAVFSFSGSFTQKFRTSFIIINEKTAYNIYATGEVLVYDRIVLRTDGKSDAVIPYNINTNTLYQLSSCSKTDSLLNIILNEYYNLGNHKKELLEHYISSLFTVLGNEIKTDSTAARTPYYDKLFEIRKNIHSRPEEKWTVDSICSQVNLSRSYFQLLYRQAFGITCINDVIECKIKLACSLLESGSDTVSAVASMCGYDSDVHFMRQFKKITGCTPSEYRKKTVRGN